MSKLNEEIRRALGDENAIYDLEREEGVFRQMAALFHGKMRWMAIVAMVYGVGVIVLMVLAAIQFFRTDDVKWQVFYGVGFLVMGQLLQLVKVWGWLQMTRYTLQRDIKRLELRLLAASESGNP